MTERGKKYVNPKEKFVVHPDALIFIQNYQPGDKFGSRIREIRREMEDNGIEYHNTDHDAEMKETAEERSKRPDFKWPLKRKRK